MPRRLRKPLSDPVLAAHSIFAQLTGEQPRIVPPAKDPAAVALGLKGGAKGGKARAAGMTVEERKESARKAAAARWGKRH